MNNVWSSVVKTVVILALVNLWVLEHVFYFKYMDSSFSIYENILKFLIRSWKEEHFWQVASASFNLVWKRKLAD